ncbi:MAG TPA: MBOAT family O-acyltransferase [Oculatellaceae cyanobacterium]
MNFATPAFLLFLVIVAGSALIANSPKTRKIILLIASYIFYATWNIPFIALILLSTSIDYFLSKQIASTTQSSERKALLTLGIAVNLVILGVFKYCNFFVDTANQTINTLFHHSHALHHLELLLPLGISFYTFEAISYLVDVYRGEAPAESFYQYNFYIMYFPHLISGPIVRYKELAPQVRDGVFLPSIETVKKGCELIILGLVYKVIFADSVSELADPVFNSITTAKVSATYLAWASFTAQIYFDFMGYTHIARGVSLLFNVSLPLNFNHPYNATNISNFWERWHISLSRWIRDYLYIPLGGSRGGAARTAWNLVLTMTIAGFWHGAGWPFIIWGAYHGFLLLFYHVVKPQRESWKSTFCGNTFGAVAYDSASRSLTLLLTSMGWIWFRSPNLETGVQFFNKLVRFTTLFHEQALCIARSDYTFFATMLLLIVMCTFGPLFVRLCNRLSLDLPYWVKVQIASTALVLCYIFAGTETKPFIYFQF